MAGHNDRETFHHHNHNHHFNHIDGEGVIWCVITWHAWLRVVAVYWSEPVGLAAVTFIWQTIDWGPVFAVT